MYEIILIFYLIGIGYPVRLNFVEYNIAANTL